ncbi:hypothetical protein JZ751_011803 [Albula glossodonta]|uniref:Uncharacterized protein n=1 Tax=Albula glossodonta TaxID=121402 RepID=A0A8T2PQW4_9TELE|nr:hypothetical protein JZ751_011803 [Albula glossodonta]
MLNKLEREKSEESLCRDCDRYLRPPPLEKQNSVGCRTHCTNAPLCPGCSFPPGGERDCKLSERTLAGVLEGLLAVTAAVDRWASVGRQVPLELGQCGEVQTALHTDVLLALLVLELVGPQLAGVGEAPPTDPAAVGLNVTVLHHVAFEVAGLGEGLVAHLALVRAGTLVRQHVRVQVAQLLEELAALAAAVGLDPAVAQNVGDQVVLGSVGLLAHAALPALLLSAHVHIVAVIHMDADAHLLCVAQ